MSFFCCDQGCQFVSEDSDSLFSYYNCSVSTSKYEEVLVSKNLNHLKYFYQENTPFGFLAAVIRVAFVLVINLDFAVSRDCSGYIVLGPAAC